jgi:hypothetical protein
VSIDVFVSWACVVHFSLFPMDPRDSQRISSHTLHPCAVAMHDTGAGAFEGVRASLRGGLDVNRAALEGIQGAAALGRSSTRFTAREA